MMNTFLLVVVMSLANLFSYNKDMVLKYEMREPKNAAEKAPLLILLHGLGSNEKDLMSFAKDLPGRFRIVAPRAPITLNEGSYAWFKVKYEGRTPGLDTNEVEQSRKLLIQFIGELKQKYKVDENEIYLCGFSQGGIMSYGVGLSQPQLLKGIGALSGRLLPQFKTQMANAKDIARLRMFISHGKSDQVLAVNEARNAFKYLSPLNKTIVYKEYEAGHYLTLPMIKDFISWLEKK